MSKLDAVIDDVTLLFSAELPDEFMVVAKCPKFKRYFDAQDLIELLELINEYAAFIDVKSEVVECRDEKDNFLLSLRKMKRQPI